MLSIENVSKSLSGGPVLREVSLHVEGAESLAVFGPPGCGKTALAAVVCGVIAPDEGRLAFSRPRQLVGLGVGRQQPSLAPDMTLQENYEMFAALGGLPRKRRSGRIAQVIEELRLSKDRARRAGEMSWMGLRAAEIGKALLPDAGLIVLDSALDGLSPELLRAAWSALESRRKQHGTALFITTYDETVGGLCGRAALMHDGKILRVGPPDELRALAQEETVLIEPLLNPLLAAKLSERSGFAVEEREDGFYVGARPDNPNLARLLADQSGIGCARLKPATLAGAIRVLIGKEEMREGASQPTAR